MKRHTVILPFALPRLTDKAAVELLDLLHEIIAGIEYHYAAQIHRHHMRRRQIRYDQQLTTSRPTDPPF